MIAQNLLTCDFANFIFRYNAMISSYEAKLKIINNSDNQIFFKIISSFGRLLIETSKCKKIQSKNSTQLNFRVKIPNQIKKGQEKMLITYSKNQMSSSYWIKTDNKILLQMKFQGQFQQDQIINQIIKGDAKQICEEGNKIFHKGDIKQAKNKFEEAYFLYRQYPQSLYGMSQCEYIEQNLENALIDIETALLIEQNQKFYFLKLKIIYQIYKHKPQCYYLLKYLKNRLQSVKKQQYFKEKDKMLKDIQQKLQKLQKQHGQKDILDFFDKVIQRFQNDQKLRKIYNNKNILQKELQDLLQIKSTNTLQQTPEQILDPISYEIMKQPVIVPTGNSYESQSLKVYMQKHGAKDPISHAILYPQWIRPNHALKNYIIKNPKLIEWVKYEAEITTFK